MGMRFNQLHQLNDDISQKMLTITLETRENDGLLRRRMYAKIPPKVEYALILLGESPTTPLMHFYGWANANMPGIIASKYCYGKAVAS